MKYEALASFFASQRVLRLRLTFDQVERHAKTRLPRSAYEHPAWWANHGGRHVQAKAWLEAGYKTENVDLGAQVVEFVRAEVSAHGVSETQQGFNHDPVQDRENVKTHPMIGAMKGTFTISGWDVTKPALDEDELAEWEARIERKFDKVAARLVKPK